MIHFLNAVEGMPVLLSRPLLLCSHFSTGVQEYDSIFVCLLSKSKGALLAWDALSAEEKQQLLWWPRAG